MQLYFSNNVASGNDQVLVYTAPNMTGGTGAGILTEQFYLDNQSTVRRAGIVGNARPITIYHKVRQLGNMYGGVANTDYAAFKPRYISTNEPTALHYGTNIRIQMMNNSARSSTSVKIIYTYLMSFRQAQ